MITTAMMMTDVLQERDVVHDHKNDARCCGSVEMLLCLQQHV